VERKGKDSKPKKIIEWGTKGINGAPNEQTDKGTLGKTRQRESKQNGKGGKKKRKGKRATRENKTRT